MTLLESLSRTLLLMRQDLRIGTPDDRLVAALVGTRVVIVADERNLTSHSAQTAYVTVAILLARMGMSVTVVAPDIALVGAQPPLLRGTLVASLLELGGDLLPDVYISTDLPGQPVDMAIILGDTAWNGPANRTVYLNADDWAGKFATTGMGRWRANDWPFGGFSAAALAASDAFNIVMRKLRKFAQHPPSFEKRYAPLQDTRFDVAPEDTPCCSSLGIFDMISAGAITQSALYALARIPMNHGNVRLFEPETSDFSNLNRYMLLRQSRAGLYKAEDLALQALGGLKIEPFNRRYEGPNDPHIGPLGDNVLVGVDHIPSRWNAQREKPGWLGIGATQGYEIAASFHLPVGPCAGCVHPYNDTNDGLIPTVSFVSFWSGLLLAALYARHAAGEIIDPSEQFTGFSGIRPDGWVQRSPASILEYCPVGHQVKSTVR